MTARRAIALVPVLVLGALVAAGFVLRGDPPGRDPALAPDARSLGAADPVPAASHEPTSTLAVDAASEVPVAWAPLVPATSARTPEPLVPSPDERLELRGRVVDDAGQLVAGARRVAVSWGEGGRVVDLADDGSFTLLVPPGRVVSLYVSCTGVSDVRGSLDPLGEGVDEIELRMLRNRRVSGRVFDDDGVPARQVTVFAFPDLASVEAPVVRRQEGTRLVLSSSLDGRRIETVIGVPEGRYGFTLPPVACRLVPAWGPGERPWWKRWEDVPETARARSVVIARSVDEAPMLFVPVRPGVTGRVVAGERGVSGVDVVLVPVSEESDLGPAWGAMKTDVDGQFVFEGVAPGRYRLVVGERIPSVRRVVEIEVTASRLPRYDVPFECADVAVHALTAEGGLLTDERLLVRVTPLGEPARSYEIREYWLVASAGETLARLPVGVYEVAAVLLDDAERRAAEDASFLEDDGFDADGPRAFPEIDAAASGLRAPRRTFEVRRGVTEPQTIVFELR